MPPKNIDSEYKIKRCKGSDKSSRYFMGTLDYHKNSCWKGDSYFLFK